MNTLPPTPSIETSSTRDSFRLSRIPLVIGCSVLTALCLCLLGGVWIFRSITTGVLAQRGELAKVLDVLIQRLADRDIEKAYDCFSSRAKRTFQMTDLENMIRGSNYALVDGYLSLEIQNLNIGKVVNANPDIHQGAVARVNGILKYENDFTGSFQAVLEKEDGIWKVDGIQINVPPAKVEDYIK